MSKPSTLLVWEEVPDQKYLYVIPNDVAEKYLHFLKEAHGKYINQTGTEDNQGLRFLNTAVSKEADSVPEEGFEEYLGVLHEYKVSDEEPLVNQNITAVYYAGFLL